MVQGNTSSGEVHQTQKVLGTGIPLFGKRFPFMQSGCEVPILVCGLTLLEISTPTHPRTPKKQGEGQSDGGGQISHTGSLAQHVWDG
jgi:hypothetical protein